MMASLNVSEMFHSIQGEGKFAGQPAIFLRLQHCNLLCSWPCDTIEVWKKGEPYEINQIITIWKKRGWLDSLSKKSTHLVITGGEPLLQQNALIELLKEFNDLFIELETNGTILPLPELDQFISQYNVSPKLQNSGMKEESRYKMDVLQWYAGKSNATFKFVINTPKDVNEIIKDFVNCFNICEKNVLLMPSCSSAQELSALSPMVVDQCKQFGFRYSPRLHLSIWNQKTGV